MPIAECLHVTEETAVLVSGHDLVRLQSTLNSRPYCHFPLFHCMVDRTLDFTNTLVDEIDLVFRVHSHRPDRIPGLHGGTEKSTSGVHSLQSI
mmetsp:Transcript_29656/g.55592  ORF Transcript_29656/g.55592 Transcript_29656/m.55592 type:complete len:93 (-) Transcript_29656:98-376(-)